MKVSNMIGLAGNKAKNQFIITGHRQHGEAGEPMATNPIETFQSYNTVIAEKEYFNCGDIVITLDAKSWKITATTSKYRSIFLGESTKETQKKIDSGEYTLANLN